MMLDVLGITNLKYLIFFLQVGFWKIFPAPENISKVMSCARRRRDKNISKFLEVSKL